MLDKFYDFLTSRILKSDTLRTKLYFYFYDMCIKARDQEIHRLNAVVADRDKTIAELNEKLSAAQPRPKRKYNKRKKTNE